MENNMITLIKNKSLVQKAASIWQTKDFDLLYEVYDINCTHHQQSKHHNIVLEGILEWRKCMEDFLAQYPDYEETITNQIAEGDKVVSILECRGLNISWSGITVDLIRENKIIETWVWFKRKSPQQ